MTIGFGRLVCSERRLHVERSTSSAFSFSSRTAARRTVHTLMGSYVALRTSTRPPSRPRRRCSASDVDPTGAGGELTAMTNLARECSGRRGGSEQVWRGRVGAQHTDLLAVVAQ